jgi:hypothetical protein
MSNKNTIQSLEEQIADLQEQLRIEKQRKESLWNDLYEFFLEKIYSSEITEDTEASCEILANLVARQIIEWANRQRESLGRRIANSGSLRMPVYTDCLNDLVLTLSQPGKTPLEVFEPLDIPEVDFQVSPWEESTVSLPNPPGPRSEAQQALAESRQPMEKLNPFSKRVNVPKPRPVIDDPV